jgi:cobalamin biosynthesis Mg chelatase CobN
MAWANNQDNSGGKQNDYLNAADTAGRPMALASILFTLLFIAAVALLLFSAGRWAYNQFIQEDAPVATTSEQAANDAATTNPIDGTPSDSASGEGSESAGTNNQASNNSSEQNTTGGSGATTTSDASSSEAASGTTATSTTPTTGASTPESVPNTGPESLLAIFAATVVIGAFAHNRWAALKR